MRHQQSRSMTLPVRHSGRGPIASVIIRTIWLPSRATAHNWFPEASSPPAPPAQEPVAQSPTPPVPAPIPGPTPGEEVPAQPKPSIDP